MFELSVLIPARNEMFLRRTVESVLENIEGNTEIIVVLDGAWADPPLEQHPRVQVIYHPVAIGQRAATNEAARVSNAKYIMKLDAHCTVDKGFDVKLMQDCEKDWTVIPRMYNLHAFDWRCVNCGERTYQGGKPTQCGTCKGTEFETVMVWGPRKTRRTDFARFDRDLHFQYWGSYEKRPEAQGDIADVMCFVGACFFMERERYFALEGLDENHGSWGQMGMEISAKSHLSGGRQVVNKKTWFAHLFRTQPGFGFPYEMRGSDQDKARDYSRWFWNHENPDALPHWDKAVYPLRWMIDKYQPVPEWHA